MLFPADEVYHRLSWIRRYSKSHGYFYLLFMANGESMWELDATEEELSRKERVLPPLKTVFLQ